jgi:hypothetical protein
MKGKFDAYVLWPFAKMFQNWIVDRSTARNFTIFEDPKFKISEGYKQKWSCPGSALLAVSV